MSTNDTQKKIQKVIEEITGQQIQYKGIKSDETISKKDVHLHLKNRKGTIIADIETLTDLTHSLFSIDPQILLPYAEDSAFSQWIQQRGELKLGRQVHLIEKEETNAEQLRKKMIDSLEQHRYGINQKTVASFQRLPKQPLGLSHIGTGSFGGKARGIAFLANIMAHYIPDSLFSNVQLSIPRSIVLATDVFDSFVKQNNLLELDFSALSDERIASHFISASLPATIIGDLRAFIRKTRKPLIVRSSSLLEDSMLQPFAGIYTSMLLPNESWETDLRFREVCNAIKYVYASTFFEKARTYIQSKGKTISDEKMAVLLQEVAGTGHEQFFYPAISGVAKSYNYYASGSCRPEDGIVYLALGLGKAIVDGGSSYCFCPSRPKTPLFGTPKDFMKYAQQRFYALRLTPSYRVLHRNEDTALESLEITAAQRHDVLEHIASTYIPADDQLYPGLYEGGAPVIDFGPIIQYEEIPLAKILQLLLKVGEITLGYPVEIEFALTFQEDNAHPHELTILQIRSMIPPEKSAEVSLDTVASEHVLCYSNNALGNGIIKGIKHIVYIKSSTFDMKYSQRAVSQIRTINKKLMSTNTPYLLIGPGRWGSADPWLGIPIVWSDIAGVKVIIETPYHERIIEPSQGSHFFHDMVSSQVGYLITQKEKGNIDWSWLNSLKILEETDDIKHVRTPHEIVIKINGKEGKAIVTYEDEQQRKRNKKR